MQCRPLNSCCLPKNLLAVIFSFSDWIGCEDGAALLLGGEEGVKRQSLEAHHLETGREKASRGC